MLEPWIIEQIRRREEEARRESERQQLPLEEEWPEWPAHTDAENPSPAADEPQRGVVIIGM